MTICGECFEETEERYDDSAQCACGEIIHDYCYDEHLYSCDGVEDSEFDDDQPTD